MPKEKSVKNSEIHGPDGYCFRQSQSQGDKYVKVKGATCNCQLDPCKICAKLYAYGHHDQGSGWCFDCDFTMWRCGLYRKGDEYKKRLNSQSYCQLCFKKKQPIGSSRVNGAPHDDWESRKYHKKCWKKIKDNETTTDESDLSDDSE